MRGEIMRPGVASIVIGATLLLGTIPVASALHLPSGIAPQPGSTPQTAPEPTFSIFGLVETPGRYDWSAGMTVGRAVAAAGGYADGGSPDELQIQRMVDGRLVSRAVTEDDPVQPDDVIMVRGRAVERPDGGRNRNPAPDSDREPRQSQDVGQRAPRDGCPPSRSSQ